MCQPVKDSTYIVFIKFLHDKFIEFVVLFCNYKMSSYKIDWPDRNSFFCFRSWFDYLVPQYLNNNKQYITFTQRMTINRAVIQTDRKFSAKGTLQTQSTEVFD